MSRGSAHPLILYLRNLAIASVSSGADDEELLDRFLRSHEEAAFAVLVRRYGPLVFGVCRRILGHAEDAEDAFQATFVVLAQKAGSIRHRRALAGFLHGVAERIARKARRARSRRRDRVMPVPERGVPDALSPVVWSDLRGVLDEEIGRLPAAYREAFILCHLEGLSNVEAARRLGCPRGTILSRLARARARLARRLSRRGLTLPAAALTTVLSVETLRASMPMKLATATVRFASLLAAEGTLPSTVVSTSVAALTTEGGKMMFGIKTIWTVGIFAVGAAVTASVLAPRTSRVAAEVPSSPVAAAPAPEARPDPPPDPVKKEKKEKKDTPLEAILRKWAEADAKTGEMRIRLTMTEIDPIYDTKTVTEGQTSVKSPGLWRIDRFDNMRRTQDILVREDKRLRWFKFDRKTEVTFIVPETPKQSRKKGIWPLLGFLIDLKGLDEQLRWLSCGPQARDIDSRYAVRLDKEDKWYIYLTITPRSPEQKWFERGRIVLECKNCQVRQVWFEYANRKEIQVDFLDRQTDLQEPITRESLSKGLPQGWKREDLNGTDTKDK